LVAPPLAPTGCSSGGWIMDRCFPPYGYFFTITLKNKKGFQIIIVKFDWGKDE
tara:strand:+ start:129 stop:287 length:159 start_codon:yes stop_codon:yes gene_type:complete